jgi:peptide/nickel transport system ATP-binding protein
MYVGKVAEVAAGMDLYVDPLHPYSEALLSAVPISNPRHRDQGKRIRLTGEVADPSNPPSGCYFHPRCRYADAKCVAEEPVLERMKEQLDVACHHARELNLEGVRMADTS